MSTTLIIYLCIALIFIIVMRTAMRRDRARLLRREKLRLKGECLQATITEIQPQRLRSIRLTQSWKPVYVTKYTVKAEANAPTNGKKLTFQSQAQAILPADMVVGMQTTIIIDPDNPRNYLFAQFATDW